MKRFSLLLLVLILATPVLATRHGSVRCEDRGIAGVVVTDGVYFAKTDAKGLFTLPDREEARFVYISIPTGYGSPVEEGVVKFYLPIARTTKSYDFNLTRKTTDQTRHGFIAIADPQICTRKEFQMLAIAAADIRHTIEQTPDTPFHGICAGDLISGDHAFYREYNDVMATTSLEFRNCMGNHDMKIWGRSHETSLQPYESVYGPCYYSYNVGQVHYVVLNDNFFIGRDWYYIGYLEEQQLAWLARDLSYIPTGSTVVVSLHIPTMFAGKDNLPFSYDKAEKSLCNHRGLYALLEPYHTHIISGHMHTTTNSVIAPNLYEHNIAAVSGAWWQGNICTDGTPAGYGVFEVDGNRISWYYKSVGYSPDFQMKLYDEQDDASFAGSIVANVWNCDPSWRVEMRADGGAPTQMERFSTIDPQGRSLYADTSKLDHKWIAVVPSDHYYKTVLPNGTKQIEVTVTDRFGQVYRVEKFLNY